MPVIEYMDGGSLEQLPPCVPEGILGRVVVSVLNALAFLQRHKVSRRTLRWLFLLKMSFVPYC